MSTGRLKKIGSGQGEGQARTRLINYGRVQYETMVRIMARRFGSVDA